MLIELKNKLSWKLYKKNFLLGRILVRLIRKINPLSQYDFLRHWVYACAMSVAHIIDYLFTTENLTEDKSVRVKNIFMANLKYLNREGADRIFKILVLFHYASFILNENNIKSLNIIGYDADNFTKRVFDIFGFNDFDRTKADLYKENMSKNSAKFFSDIQKDIFTEGFNIKQPEQIEDFFVFSPIFWVVLASTYKDFFNELERLYENYTISMSNTDAREYVRQGRGYFLLHQLDKATELFLEAIRVDPNCIEANYNLGLICELLDKNDKAIYYFQKVLSVNPNYNTEVYYQLGLTYYEIEDHDKAIEYCLKAINLNPSYSEAYCTLGSAYGQGKNDYDNAIKYLKESIKLKPNFPHAYYKLGFFYSMGKGEYEEAIKYLNKAINLDPNLAAAYYVLGFAYLNLRKYEEAKSNAIKAYELCKQQGNSQMAQEVEEILKEIP